MLRIKVCVKIATFAKPQRDEPNVKLDNTECIHVLV